MNRKKLRRLTPDSLSQTGKREQKLDNSALAAVGDEQIMRRDKEHMGRSTKRGKAGMTKWAEADRQDEQAQDKNRQAGRPP